MVSIRTQMAGCVLAVLGWVGVLVVCVAPMWRVTTVTANATTQTTWEGTSMRCVAQDGGERRCRGYDAVTPMSSDLEGPQGLAMASIITSSAGLLVFGFAGRCAKLVPSERTKAKFSVLSGAVLLIGGVLCLVPVSQIAHAILRDDRGSSSEGVTREAELGACLYVGWVSALLLMAGGGILCASWPAKEDVTFWPFTLHRTGQREREIQQLN